MYRRTIKLYSYDMPINIPDALPAVQTLIDENIFFIPESKAIHQDIRPLHIGILNLMPLKITTETHILRQLSNTPLQIEIDLLKTASHTTSHTPFEHMEAFYKTFDEIKHKKYDGFIITGAPVEKLDFEEVTYWEELQHIMNWVEHNVTSTLYICWAAQAGLYHHYGIQKYPLPEKLFGVFSHKVYGPTIPLVRGFDDRFYAPHSRYTEIRREDIRDIPELLLLSESEEAGVYIVLEKNGKKIFVTGHSEYDPETLKLEYLRDKQKGIPVSLPKNYFPQDDPSNDPEVCWRSHGSLLFSNWLNYYVYQVTPYNLNEII